MLMFVIHDPCSSGSSTVVLYSCNNIKYLDVMQHLFDVHVRIEQNRIGWHKLRKYLSDSKCTIRVSQDAKPIRHPS